MNHKPPNAQSPELSQEVYVHETMNRFEYANHLATYPKELLFIPRVLLKNSLLIATAVKYNPKLITLVSPEFLAKPEIVEKIMKESYSTAIYKYLPESLKYRLDIFTDAVKRNADIFKALPGTLQSNSTFVESALTVNPRVFELLAPELQLDRVNVLLAINSGFKKLNILSSEFRADRDIVLKIVRQDGIQIVYAHPDLQKDAGVVRAAVMQSEIALEFAHASFRDNLHILKIMVTRHVNGIKKISPYYLDDEELMMESIKYHPNNLEYVSDRLKNNFDLVITAVKTRGTSLRYASDELKSNISIIEAAATQNEAALLYAAEPYCFDLRTLASIFKKQVHANTIIPPNVKEFLRNFSNKEIDFSSIGRRRTYSPEKSTLEEVIHNALVAEKAKALHQKMSDMRKKAAKTRSKKPDSTINPNNVPIAINKPRSSRI